MRKCKCVKCNLEMAQERLNDILENIEKDKEKPLLLYREYKTKEEMLKYFPQSPKEIMNNWKIYDRKSIPIDDKSYLVAYRKSDGSYSDPHRAYFVYEEGYFFSCECHHSFPLHVDAYMEIPTVSTFTVNS